MSVLLEMDLRVGFLFWLVFNDEEEGEVDVDENCEEDYEGTEYDGDDVSITKLYLVHLRRTRMETL